MRYIDVTLPIGAGMPGYPGDPPVEVAHWNRIASGADFNVSVLRLGSHTGTHIDAPLHCLPGGAPVDALPLELLCGPALVVDVAVALDDARLGALLSALPAGCERLLLRTGNRWTPDHHAPIWRGLCLAQAETLVERGVRLLGVDRLSIAEGDATLPVHRLLLERGVVIVEGLD